MMLRFPHKLSPDGGRPPKFRTSLRQSTNSLRWNHYISLITQQTTYIFRYAVIFFIELSSSKGMPPGKELLVRSGGMTFMEAEQKYVRKREVDVLD
jgi:hypothetical protein